jgi:tRNA (adenine-N(1)-)-methyltransferase non-catalytic subunit
VHCCCCWCFAQAGEDIIAALCSNSATFEGKTEFAQEKYKRRKARKYTTTLSLRRPTSWGLCEVGRQRTAGHLGVLSWQLLNQ